MMLRVVLEIESSLLYSISSAAAEIAIREWKTHAEL